MPSEVALDWGVSQDTFGLQSSRGEIVYPSLKSCVRSLFVVPDTNVSSEQYLVSGWPAPCLPPPAGDRTPAPTTEANLSTGP
eukprot:14605107-Heterocapsa_arctica.AAC.1